MLPLNDPTTLVPCTRRGGVIEDYPAYHYALKAAIQRYENGRETSGPPFINIMLRDPYYVAFTLLEAKKLGKCL